MKGLEYEFEKTILILPTPLAQRHPIAFSCKYRLFGRLVYPIRKLDKKKAYLMKARHVITKTQRNLIYIKLKVGRPSIEEISPSKLRDILLKLLSNELVIEPKPVPVKDIIHKLMQFVYGLTYWYAITNDTIYTMTTIPDELKATRYFIQIPLLIIFAE